MRSIGMPLKLRVTLEPNLEHHAQGMTAEECERAARLHYRYAKQFWMRASILRLDDRQTPRWIRWRLGRRLIWLPPVDQQAE
jgi:hypothetical protein